MKKITLLAGAVAVALSSSVMAEDFHALGNIKAAPIQDTELAVIEGGASCSTSGAANSGPGGFAACATFFSLSGAKYVINVTNSVPATFITISHILAF